MSGFYLLGLIAIWLFVGWLIYRFWRNATSIRDLNKITYYVLGVVLLLVWFGSGFWPFVGKKMYYDAQIRAMCAKDGGLKIYETVELPAERFDKYGNIGINSEEKAKLTDEYYYKTERNILKKDDPTLIKYTTQVFRRRDGKVLGELIRYGRGGGDLPGFWHPSTYNCPSFSRGENNLETSIFIKGF
ncbi:MAG: hypothetical protein KZQ95_21620 [Candidatus Thiodiazotropha sp. (ex Epidulcina cf. delphinae)]|nr:hypothetical protein [Candidatus Thiodiazotropha sp. (ex Epidulcina cf. delphinae)]